MWEDFETPAQTFHMSRCACVCQRDSETNKEKVCVFVFVCIYIFFIYTNTHDTYQANLTTKHSKFMKPSLSLSRSQVLSLSRSRALSLHSHSVSRRRLLKIYSHQKVYMPDYSLFLSPSRRDVCVTYELHIKHSILM